MPDRSSRHAGLPTYRRRIPGRETDGDFFQPRLRTTAPRDSLHKVRATERLDHIAFRYFGDPHEYWRIADANPGTDLEALAEPGRLLAIPERA
ncbi:MAG: LysM domain-containing protein [Rhodospirillaceae bacterium]|nr:LysM domain-containing protein [Rhodospirillaceae bacterium]